MDLRVELGESIALMGPSGSGGSTLLHCVAGILVPDAGSLRVVDTDVASMGESARARFRLEHLGLIFQLGELVSELTLEENVMLPLQLLGRARQEARVAAVDMLDRLGVAEVSGRRAGEVSGGQAQRAEIEARARTVPGVRDTAVTHIVAASCDNGSVLCEHLEAEVASCQTVQQLVPGATGCLDDRAAWIGQPYDMPGSSVALTLSLHRDDPGGAPTGPPLAQTPLDRANVVRLPPGTSDRLSAAILVPSGLPGVQEALAETGYAQVQVIADPRRDLVQTMGAAGLDVNGYWDFGEMDRIQRTIDTVRLVGAIALVLGLTSCAVGALDRATERRREVVRLQLLGVPSRTLTLSHWLEVAVPILLGAGLALGLGWLSADAYLSFASQDENLRIPLSFIGPMIAAAGIGSLVVAWITSLFANPKIRPELIRAA